MKKNLTRFLSGSFVAAAMLALSPAAASAAYAEPELKCTETETRLVCCLVDGTEVLDCKVSPL